MPKRGERVARPARKGDWELRHTGGSVDGWEQLCAQAPGPAGDAWDALSHDPFARSARQHPLHGALGRAYVGPKQLEQWQYEVTGAARIWYCADRERRLVHLTMVSVGHPKATE